MIPASYDMTVDLYPVARGSRPCLSCQKRPATHMCDYKACRSIICIGCRKSRNGFDFCPKHADKP